MVTGYSKNGNGYDVECNVTVLRIPDNNSGESVAECNTKTRTKRKKIMIMV